MSITCSQDSTEDSMDKTEVSSRVISRPAALNYSCSYRQLMCDVFAAHSGSVRGVSVDALNQLMVSAGADRLLKVWKFKSKELLNTHSLQAAPASTLLHRDR